MTDAEIIKALRLHQQTGVSSCDECPYKGKMCNIILTRDALDLINRQKAEIDILIRKKEALQDELCGLQEMNEALISGQETLQKYIAELKEMVGE